MGGVGEEVSGGGDGGFDVGQVGGVSVNYVGITYDFGPSSFVAKPIIAELMALP